MYTGPKQIERTARVDALAKVIQQFAPDPLMLAEAIHDAEGLARRAPSAHCLAVAAALSADETSDTEKLTWPLGDGRIAISRWADGELRISIHLGQRERRHGFGSEVVTPDDLRGLAAQIHNVANRIEAGT